MYCRPPRSLLLGCGAGPEVRNQNRILSLTNVNAVIVPIRPGHVVVDVGIDSGHEEYSWTVSDRPDRVGRWVAGEEDGGWRVQCAGGRFPNFEEATIGKAGRDSGIGLGGGGGRQKWHARVGLRLAMRG